MVTVHGYFERIEQRTQCQNAHFQLNSMVYSIFKVAGQYFSQANLQNGPIIILLANLRTIFDFQNRTILYSAHY